MWCVGACDAHIAMMFCQANHPNACRDHGNCSFLISCFTFSTVAKPGRTILQVAREASTRRTWCWMSSCNLGTLASFALLPIREVVDRSSSKSGAMLSVRTGAGEPGAGGVIDSYRERQ